MDIHHSFNNGYHKSDNSNFVNTSIMPNCDINHKDNFKININDDNEITQPICNSLSNVHFMSVSEHMDSNKEELYKNEKNNALSQNNINFISELPEMNFNGNCTESENVISRTFEKEITSSIKHYDRRSITSISSDSKVEVADNIFPSHSNICHSVDTISTSMPTNTISKNVRSSRSQENYYSSGETTCVDIDFDDKIASSVDALCHDIISLNSYENMSLSDWRVTGHELEVIEDCETVSLEEKKSSNAMSITEDQVNEALKLICKSLTSESRNAASKLKNDNSFDESDIDVTNGCIETVSCLPVEELCYNKNNFSKSRDADRPSAARLAKRLYHLQGFRAEDIHRHLSKKNSFAQLVGEEYLNYFDFSNEKLEDSLRTFLNQMGLWEETQDRERLLYHFSRRYYTCNPDNFENEDSCLILSTAILLLNNEIHTQMNSSRTELDFTSHLMGLSDHVSYPPDLLHSIYESILKKPLQSNRQAADNNSSPLKLLTSFSITETPDPKNPIDYKKGYVMRKCCLDSNGRRTSLGRRGWKMFYATLRDMTIYMHTDEAGFKRSNYLSNSISIHHSLAIKASDYVKKSHVIRLQTADMAQYLIQTSNTKECQEWVDSINFVAANFSAPMRPIDWTDRRQLDRPFLPSNPTRLTLQDQMKQHESMVSEYEKALLEHRKCPPEKGSKSRVIQDYCRMENTLKFECKRFKVYCRLLQFKISSFPDIDMLKNSGGTLVQMEDGEMGVCVSAVHERHNLHTLPIHEDANDSRHPEES